MNSSRERTTLPGDEEQRCQEKIISGSNKIINKINQEPINSTLKNFQPSSIRETGESYTNNQTINTH